MFQGINPIAQIIIAISILLVFFVIAVIIFRRGIKLGYNKGYISLGQGECAPGIIQVRRKDLEIIFDIFVNSVSEISEITGKQSLMRKMNYAESKLPIIRQRMDKIYYELSKTKGIDDDFLTDNEDLAFYLLVVDKIIDSDNGLASIKSLLRKYLRDNEYKKSGPEYNRYLDEFNSLVFENCRRILNDKYKSLVSTIGLEERRKRVIHSKEIFEAFQDRGFMDSIEDIFRDIFDHAKLIDIDIENEKIKIIEKRKKRLADIIDTVENE